MVHTEKGTFILDTNGFETEKILTPNDRSDASFLVGKQKIAFFQRIGSNLAIQYYQKGSLTQGKEIEGKWRVINAIQLANQTIIYSTDTDPAGIHKLEKDGKNSTILPTGTSPITDLRKLPNGLIVGQIDKHTFKIFKPDDISFSLNYKQRLLVGEGDFTYTEDLLCKHRKTHPNLPHSITATELKYPPPSREVQKRVEYLKEEGVDIQFGIDAKQLDQYFRGRRFERIQWNCPYGHGFPDGEAVPKFFEAVSRLQKVGDRIHVHLVQGSGEYWKTRQTQNPIVLGSVKASYALIKKRDFSNKRYPGYRHTMTGTSELYIAGGDEREFVFEKTDIATGNESLQKAIALKDRSSKTYTVDTDTTPIPEDLEHYYFDCSTDEDSSDYETDQEA